MKEKFHLTDNVAILNFDLALPDTKSGLLKSEEFKAFALRYMDYLRTHDTDLYEWAAAGKSDKEAVEDLCRLGRMILVFDIQEVSSPYLDGTDNALNFVEGIFNYWKDHQRYSITTNRLSDTESTVFVNQDSEFNQLIRNTFRKIEQSLSGHPNKIFRQQCRLTHKCLS